MGQYYKVVFLSESGEIIRAWVQSRQIKLMEHSYLNEPFMIAIEHLLSIQGMFYKSRIVWAGDYANECVISKSSESPENKNLYHLASYDNPIHKDKMLALKQINVMLPYIVNHTKKMFVDKTKEKNIHPLPLLVSEGNGSGGGDYYGKHDELCGTWSRNIISMESTLPEGYTELVCQFE
jgi:hypothetical protein